MFELFVFGSSDDFARFSYRNLMSEKNDEMCGGKSCENETPTESVNRRIRCGRRRRGWTVVIGPEIR